MVDGFELLHGEHDRMNLLLADRKAVSPETQVRPRRLDFPEPFNFASVCETLHEFVSNASSCCRLDNSVACAVTTEDKVGPLRRRR